MKVSPFERSRDLYIARTRIVLSMLAMLSLYIDPTTAGRPFSSDPVRARDSLSHLAYSVGNLFFAQIPKSPSAGCLLRQRCHSFFAMAIAYLTEGQTGPSYVFFVFAIIAVGVRATPRAIIYVTLLGVVLYLAVISANDSLTGAYVMRAVYLAIAGYLIGFFAQQRANYEARVRELEAQAERQ